MIRISRRETAESRAAISSLEKAKAGGRNVNTPEVVRALNTLFHGKCYICEDKTSTTYEVEHFAPHGGKRELKYAWDNLFWSCGHCNNTKGPRYWPLLDCTKEDVDEEISFVKEGYFGTEERLVFTPLDEREQTENTVKLLRDVYYGTTPQKKLEANILRKKVREELTRFISYVRNYYDEQNPSLKEDLESLLRMELSAGSPFAAFKRWMIKGNKDRYPEVYKMLEEAMDCERRRL